MKITRFETPSSTDTLLLAGDIGGTNTNIALVARRGEKYINILETVSATDEITNFMVPLRATLAAIQKEFPQTTICACCISAAGPVSDNRCELTNADWSVDGPLIQQETGIPTRVVNDFIALSYGIPLLDVNDSNSIIQFPLADGSKPKQKGKTKAVVGAGTGLGVGFIPWTGDRYLPCPSEGGHFDFPAFDEETTELMLFLRRKLGFQPGMERLVSGYGLTRILEWLLEKENPAEDEVLKTIAKAPEVDKPMHISLNSENHELCGKVHKIFRKIYGKAAGNYAAAFLPTGGLYIAGGVIAKNEKQFLADNTFIEAFSTNHKKNISGLLKEIPVYIVRDYSTSLLGAAAAAMELCGR